MDFNKIKNLVSKEVILDLKNADDQELRFNYRGGNDNTWMEVTPSNYSSEEELAAVINIDIERKRHGKIKKSLKSE